MTRARLVALFGLGLLLMNFPLLSLFSQEYLVLGMPVCPCFTCIFMAHGR